MLLVGLAVLNGCGTAAEAGPEPTASPTAPETAVQAVLPEEEALDAYNGMWDTVVEGSHEGTVGHPGLSRYATGQALELTTGMLNGRTATGEPARSAEVVEAFLEEEPPRVLIEDCLDDSGWAVEGAEPGSPGGSGSRLVEATVTEDELLGWRVEELWLEDYGSCRH